MNIFICECLHNIKWDQPILYISSKAQLALDGIRFTIILTLDKYKLASNKSQVIWDQARFYQRSYIRSYSIGSRSFFSLVCFSLIFARAYWNVEDKLFAVKVSNMQIITTDKQIKRRGLCGLFYKACTCWKFLPYFTHLALFSLVKQVHGFRLSTCARKFYARK